MDEAQLMHKKRRQDSHYQSDYHPRYKKPRDDWRSGNNYRDKERYADRQDRNRGGPQYNRNPEWDVEIPCKHVFCFKCAKKTDKNCPRCGDEVHRIEQCRHGTVWMCSVMNCSRTYLSQRDLQAHINHRHNKPALSTITVPPPPIPGNIMVPPPPVSTIPPQVPPYVLMPNTSQPPPSILPPPVTKPGIPASQEVVSRPISNLITIQIQDNPAQAGSNVAPQWPMHPSARTQGRSNY